MSRANSCSLSLPPQEMPIKTQVGGVRKGTAEDSVVRGPRDGAHGQEARVFASEISGRLGC